MAPDTGTTEPERTAERWRWMGIRLGTSDTKSALWQDARGETRVFAVNRRTEASAIGGYYTAQVTRKDDGSLTLHGAPQFEDGADRDDELATQWAAEDRVARVILRRLARERSAAKQDPLDQALEPLLTVAAKLRTGHDRDALAAYVLRRLNNAWATR